MAGLIRKDFQDTIRQVPVLGSLPIIGTLFRSTGFQREETELVIIVTPRLVRPVSAAQLKAPTDRVKPPNEADLFLLGRTDTGVGPAPELGVQNDAGRPAAPGGGATASRQVPTGASAPALEKANAR
jgi:pilus assembly protein CpaC